MKNRVYECPLEHSPELPRQSIFSYLFPRDDTNLDSDSPQFIDGLTDRRVSRRQLETQAKRLAAGLRRLRLKRDDVICVFGQNSLEWLNAVYGSLAAGLVISPINYGYTPQEVLHQLRDSTACLCFVSPALYPTLLKALELAKGSWINMDASRIILLCSPNEKKPELASLRCTSDLWEDEIELDHFGDGDEHRTAWLCYSSGTVSTKVF